ncbi:hypothetical protein, partial [Methanothrix sp.]|uniref:hypothetical protein n=1 Tax=Methanothrix sp. TaxID=90426 RepID=UPI00329A71C8
MEEAAAAAKLLFIDGMNAAIPHYCYRLSLQIHPRSDFAGYRAMNLGFDILRLPIKISEEP